ncbi:MAG: hypothetical protein AAGC74_12920 [Verrucomicrobiota bacterium]
MLLLLLLGNLSIAPAAVLSLASTMDPASRITEYNITGSFTSIENGDGSAVDIDGFYDINNPSNQFGNGTGDRHNTFPNEENFSIGTLEFDETLIVGTGTEIIPVTAVSIDLSNDIAATGLRPFTLDSPNSFTFGNFNSGASLTFDDGLLSSISLSIPVFLNYLPTLNANPFSYTAELAINGDAISISGDHTATITGQVPTGFTGGPFDSRMVFDLNGSVNAVGTFFVPEPTTSSLIPATLFLVFSRRNRPSLETTK